MSCLAAMRVLPALTFILLGGQAFAGEIPEFSQFLGDQIDATSCSLEESGTADPVEEWYFKRFWLRVRGKVSFSVPGLAGIQITPEIEMLWERPDPEGWTRYRPAR